MKLTRFMLLLMTFALGLTTLWGCAKNEAPKESVIVRAYKLIDSDRAKDAVALLENYRKENNLKDERDSTVALASAYAALAGLQIYNFYDVLDEVVVKKATDFSTAHDTSGGDKNASTKRTDLVLGAMFTWMRATSNVIKIFRILPPVSDENIIYLKEAMRLMGQLTQPFQNKGDALFSAILKTTYFKYRVSTVTIPSMLTMTSEGRCQINVHKGVLEIVFSAESLAAVFQDLAVAFPKSKDDWIKANNSLVEASETLQATAIMADVAKPMLEKLLMYDLGGTICGK